MSTLNVSNITDGTTTVGTSYVVNGSAKAWANLSGFGTIALRDSFNTSSVTDHAVGVYGFDFTSAMNSADYKMHLDRAANGSTNPNYVMVGHSSYYSTSGFRSFTNGATGGAVDSDYVFAGIDGDLA